LHLMKPSPSIPRALDAKVTRVAKRLHKSRQLVLREAIDEYVRRHDPDAVTEAMNRVADAIDTTPDPAHTAAVRSILERTDW